MQLCLHVHQHERVLVSTYVCAVLVSLLGPCQEASVTVYLYVYVHVRLRVCAPLRVHVSTQPIVSV